MSGLVWFVYLFRIAAAVLLGLSRFEIFDIRGAVVGSRKVKYGQIGLDQPIFLNYTLVLSTTSLLSSM